MTVQYPLVCDRRATKPAGKKPSRRRRSDAAVPGGAAVLLALALALGNIACSKKPSEGGVRLDQIADAFSSAGLKADRFQAADASRFSAIRCLAGRVDDIDLMVCEYGSPGALALGKRAGERWVGSATTAAVLGNGRMLLVVADRAHADPSGKTIHKITQAFTKTRHDGADRNDPGF